VSDRKRCTQCQQWKLLNDFSPCRSGLQPACKRCRNETARAKPAVIAVAEKACMTCKQTLPASAFWKARHNATGLQKQCKACCGARKATVRFAVTLSEKTCRDCGVTKPASDFCIDVKRKGGLRSECRECTSVRTRASVYSLDLNAAKELCDRCDCGICGATLATQAEKHIDHCHATGKVRGVLCGPCNRMLSNARDRSDVLISGAQYLRDSGTDKAPKEKISA